MSELNDKNPLESLENWLRDIICDELRSATNGNSYQEGDRLLEAEEAAKILSVSEDWIYRHASRLPFTRKLGPKMLRFSSQGIQKWMATRKVANTTSGS